MENQNEPNLKLTLVRVKGAWIFFTTLLTFCTDKVLFFY